MKKSDIEVIIETQSDIKSIGGYPYFRNIKEISNEIYELHLRDKIEMLERLVEYPTKPGYKRSDVIDEIKKLKSILESN